MENDFDSPVYHKHSIEFVTVASEFCRFLENASAVPADEFLDKAVKIMPLLYLKATLLPDAVQHFDEEIERFVDEMAYMEIREQLLTVLGPSDNFLEVFHEDMRLSDTPILCSVSELLADIYQDVKDFVSTYQLGVTEIMNDGLVLCKSSFEKYWGQKLVNVLRALHSVRYNTNDDEEMLFGEGAIKGADVSKSFIALRQKEWSNDDKDYDFE